MEAEDRGDGRIDTGTTNRTGEKLAEVLKDDPRGARLLRDELAGWVKGMDQYKNRGGGTPDDAGRGRTTALYAVHPSPLSPGSCERNGVEVDAITDTTSADLKSPGRGCGPAAGGGHAAGSPCPSCGKPREVKVRCWKCCDMTCVRCGKLTGSAFLSLCIPCGGAADAAVFERWVIVVEKITVGRDARRRPTRADIPVHHRVKRGLKALADCGLRCVALPDVPPEGALTDRPLEADWRDPSGRALSRSARHGDQRRGRATEFGRPPVVTSS